MINYVYPLVHAGEVSVVGVVGAIISVTTIVVVITIPVVVLAMIARKRKVKTCGTFDLEATVSVDKYSMRILVYCTVFLCCMALVYFNSQDLVAVLNWYNFVEKMDEWLSYS